MCVNECVFLKSSTFLIESTYSDMEISYNRKNFLDSCAYCDNCWNTEYIYNAN